MKKRQEELRSELDVFNVKLEEAKLCRETAEQELKGYEAELALNESVVQSLEVLFLPLFSFFKLRANLIFMKLLFSHCLQARISTIQAQICAVKSNIEDLKVHPKLFSFPPSKSPNKQNLYSSHCLKILQYIPFYA